MPLEPVRWARLEPRARDKSLAPGLEARIHDPLWLLGRQWQFGELNADGNVGSAVVAEITAQIVPVSRYRPGRADGGAVPQLYDVSGRPLETLVEAEDARIIPLSRARVRGGQHFERLLTAHGVGHCVPAFRTAYPLQAASGLLDTAERRFTRVLAGRVVDGTRLYPALSSSLRPASGQPRLPAAPALDGADVDKVRVAAEDWLIWADALISAPAAPNAAWLSDRMEYAFGIGTASTDGAAVKLEVDEYTDGELDWYAFTAEGTAPPAPAGSTAVIGPLTVVPSAVTYPGMAASRLWEFEDARVDFGSIQAEPDDLGRMLLAEFALVFGADWLVVPLEVPVGSLVRIVGLRVRDTFGRTVSVGPTGALDGPSGSWRMFGLSSASTTAGTPLDMLFAAPALAQGLQGPAIEELQLLRDEAANMVWAVEHVVEGEHGGLVDRAAASYARRSDSPAPPAASGTLAYRLRTDVPEHWFPLLPQRLEAGNPSMTLRLGSLPIVQPDGTIVPIRPRGRLLSAANPGTEVILREEEVPREGARVTRAYQLARWFDGTTFLWLGRRKAVGRGEGSGGLRFDDADEK